MFLLCGNSNQLSDDKFVLPVSVNVTEDANPKSAVK